MAEALEQSGLSVASPRERATLAGSQLVGLAMIRYVLRLEPIASASIDHLAEVVGRRSSATSPARCSPREQGSPR